MTTLLLLIFSIISSLYAEIASSCGASCCSFEGGFGYKIRINMIASHVSRQKQTLARTLASSGSAGGASMPLSREACVMLLVAE